MYNVSFSFESLEACYYWMFKELDNHMVMVSSPMYTMFVQFNVMLRSYLRADCMHTHTLTHRWPP